MLRRFTEDMFELCSLAAFLAMVALVAHAWPA